VASKIRVEQCDSSVPRFKTVQISPTTSYTFQHDLGNNYPQVSLWRVGTGILVEVEADVTSVDENTIKVDFAVTPSDDIVISVVG